MLEASSSGYFNNAGDGEKSQEFRGDEARKVGYVREGNYLRRLSLIMSMYLIIYYFS